MKVAQVGVGCGEILLVTAVLRMVRGQARDGVARLLERRQRFRRPPRPPMDVGGLAVDADQLLAIARDGRVRLDQGFTGRPSSDEGREGFVIPPKPDEDDCGQPVDPGRRRGDPHDRRVGGLRQFEHVSRLVVGGQRLGQTSGVDQVDSHVAKVPGQFVADVGILGVRLEQRLAQVVCPLVCRQRLLPASGILQSHGQGGVYITKR